jgi:hypothetical protein
MRSGSFLGMVWMYSIESDAQVNFLFCAENVSEILILPSLLILSAFYTGKRPFQFYVHRKPSGHHYDNQRSWLQSLGEGELDA